MDELMRLGLNNAAWATALALAVAVGARVFWRRPAVVHILWLLVLIKLVSPSLVRVDFPAILAQRHDSPGASRIAGITQPGKRVATPRRLNRIFVVAGAKAGYVRASKG